jgi:hypothetical protein
MALALLAAQSVAAREPLGLFDGWAAFRDAQPPRCYAIAEPELRRKGSFRPFAAVGTWPTRKLRGQLHIRLREAKEKGAPVLLWVDDRRFRLVAGGADAWALDARSDAAIVAAMRGGRRMRVETRSARGRVMSDSYPLRGVATAIDAAAVACARVR